MAECNGCHLEQLKKRYGDKLIKYKGSYYLKGVQPSSGQDEPSALPDGTPIYFIVRFMTDGHDHSQSQAEMMVEDELERRLSDKW